MKKEQERPKIKLKVRQTDKNLSDSFDENKNEPLAQNAFDQTGEKESPQKIIIHASNKIEKEKNEKDEKQAKKWPIFQICAIILTILLTIAIVVEIFVMIGLKTNTDKLKNKNGKLPQVETSISTQI